MSYTTFILGFWAITLIAVVIAVTSALIVGLSDANRSTSDADRLLAVLKWRWRKLISSVLGVVGILLLIYNFEQVVRDFGQNSAKDYVLNEFLAAKFRAVFEAGRACANVATSAGKENCGFWRAVDTELFPDRLRSNSPFSRIEKWLLAEDPDGSLTRINRNIDNINLVLSTATEQRLFSPEARITIALMSVVFVIVSLWGALGDAAYQYRIAKRETELVAVR